MRQTLDGQIAACRFPMAQAMPLIQNLVHDFLTAPANRKMSPWVGKSSGLQLSALGPAMLSLDDCIAADWGSAKPLWWSANKWDVGPADFRILVDDTIRLGALARL